MIYGEKDQSNCAREILSDLIKSSISFKDYFEALLINKNAEEEEKTMLPSAIESRQAKIDKLFKEFEQNQTRIPRTKGMRSKKVKVDSSAISQPMHLPPSRIIEIKQEVTKRR